VRSSGQARPGEMIFAYEVASQNVCLTCINFVNENPIGIFRFIIPTSLSRFLKPIRIKRLSNEPNKFTRFTIQTY